MSIEHSIFISYRKIDGCDLTSWVFKNFSGRSIVMGSQAGIITTQIDLAIPGSYDWKVYLDTELAKAKSLIVVCSPATMFKYRDRPDYFYHEIDWWINNRRDIPPILIAIKEDTHKYVPYPVQDCWPNLQVAEISSNSINKNDNHASKRFTDIFIESLTRGICSSYEYSGNNMNLCAAESPIVNMEGVFAWEKDRFGRYTFANELYARAAGFDSPSSMLGKTDFNMPWRSLANTFIQGDKKLMTGNESSRIGSLEKEIMAEKVADILVNEGVIKDHSDRIIGVRGCFFDVTNALTNLITKKYFTDETGVYLGPNFGHEHLTNEELYVLKSIIKIMPKEKIARNLGKKLSEIKAIIGSIKTKLQCKKEEDIIVTTIRAGLTLELFGQDM